MTYQVWTMETRILILLLIYSRQPAWSINSWEWINSKVSLSVELGSIYIYIYIDCKCPVESLYKHFYGEYVPNQYIFHQWFEAFLSHFNSWLVLFLFPFDFWLDHFKMIFYWDVFVLLLLLANRIQLCFFFFFFGKKKKFLFPQFVTVFFVMYNGWHGVAPAPTKGILGNARLYWTWTMLYAPKQNFRNSYICKFLILLIWVHYWNCFSYLS